MTLLLGLAAVVLAAACGTAAASTPFTLLPSTLKVRPHQSPWQLYSPAAAGVAFEVLTARNEYESFQLAASGAMTITEVVVDMPYYDFQFQVHAIWTYFASQPSDCNSQPGLWPDALIPVRDVWYHEARDAFPIQLEGPSTGGAWVDVFTPPSVWAGNYSGDVVVTYNTTVGVRQTARLPFTMVVADLVLPSVSPRRAYFSYTTSSPAMTNYSVETMGQHYMDLGLMHRISLADAFLASPQLNSVKHVNLEAFDDKWGKYLRGCDTPFGLQDTRVTTFIMPAPICEDNFTAPFNPAVHAQQQYWAKLAQWFREEGLLDAVELVDYTIDEPSDYWEWQELEARARAVHASDPAIRTLATTSMAQAIAAGAESAIDLWVPIINSMEPKGTGNGLCFSPAGNRRADYANVTAERLWWYQSCMSHGCEGGCTADPDAACEMSWPSYMVDASAVANRVMGWATYLYDVSGELYWRVNAAAELGMNAFEDQWFAGGNGDGTLTYRGLPSIIGGRHEVPIASIRLKMIRDAQEDLLYMLAAEQVIGRDAVLDIVRTVIVNDFAFNDDYQLLLAARQRLLAATAVVTAQR